MTREEIEAIIDPLGGLSAEQKADLIRVTIRPDYLEAEERRTFPLAPTHIPSSKKDE